MTLELLSSQLARELSECQLVPECAIWHRLNGGRTNTSWRVVGRGIDIVCKLFQENQNNPLFPNLPDDEFKVLKYLHGSSLSPDPIAYQKTSVGVCIVYKYVEGESISGRDVEDVGLTLSQLHSTEIRSDVRLRKLTNSKKTIPQIGLKILNGCSTELVKNHRDRQPEIPHLPSVSPVLLHGDLVPANIVRSEENLSFIDWQCPAIGDPCEDIATFLSPAMQYLYAGKPLNSHEETCFMNGYNDLTISERYILLEPYFHWRMAAYCLWKAERGSEDYLTAYSLEMEALETVG